MQDGNELDALNAKVEIMEAQIAEARDSYAQLQSFWNAANDAFGLTLERVHSLEEALRSILEIGKRDMTNPKYDSYFETAEQLLNPPSGEAT